MGNGSGDLPVRHSPAIVKSALGNWLFIIGFPAYRPLPSVIPSMKNR